MMAMTAEQIELLIVKSKYTGDNNAEFLLHKLIYQRCCDAAIDNESVRTIVTIIIASILLDQPLVTQRQYIKSLYKHYGTEANKSKAILARMKHDLQIIERRGAGNQQLKATLVEQIVSENKILDDYAQEQSLKTNHCPNCLISDVTQASYDCAVCDGAGKITLTIDDAQALFKQLDISYSPSHFASEYWHKIQSIVGELQIN